MATLASIPFDPGTTSNLAAYQITESATTKFLNRSTINDSSGSELIGQKAMAGSLPVVLASDQASIPVTLTSTTITGTVAATQSGVWNITNLSGTVSLPTGAATAAKQPALGAAGSASTDVITIQGIASGTVVPVSVATVGHGTAAAAIRVELPTDGTGVVGINAGSAKIGQVAIDQTTPGTTNLVALAANQSVNAAQVAGTATAVNTGNSSAGTQRVVIATDQPAISMVETYTDIAPATQNITAVDAVTASSSNFNAQTFYTGTPTAGSAASFALSGIQSVAILVTGTWSATLQLEYSRDGGTTWHVLLAHQNSIYNVSTGITANFTANSQTTGMTNVRVRCTAYTSGTAVVKVVESAGEAVVSINNAVPSGNFVSVNNSTVATLTSGSVFTGTSDDAREYSEIRVTVFADQVSATNGLSIQQSTDNTNWDVTDTYTVPITAAGSGKTYSVPRQARYFRVVYTNGGTNQGTFRLATILNRMATTSSSQRPSDAYSNENDFEQVWSVGSVWNGATWDRAPGDTTGTKVKQVAGTATLSNVAGSASSVTLLAANTARIGAQITNDSSALLYIKFGTTASTTSYTVVLAGAASAPFSYYEVPAGYSGRIDGIWASAVGNARITEES